MRRIFHSGLLWLAHSGLLLLALLLTPALRADVTIRYQTNIKPGPLLAATAAAASPYSSGNPLYSRNSLLEIKGDKAHTDALPLSSILDFSHQQITVMDPAHKLFATVSTADYSAQISRMAVIPPVQLPSLVQTILSSAKADFSCRATGRTDKVLDVAVEETECTSTISLSAPGGGPPPSDGSAAPSVILLKVVAQRWTPAPAEVTRRPELAELARYNSGLADALNPLGLLKPVLEKLPLFGENFGPMLEALLKDNAGILRLDLQIFSPALMQIAPLLQQRIQLPPGLDPNAPLAEISMEGTELSGAPLDDSVFQVPADYQPAPLPDIFKNLVPAPPTPAPNAGTTVAAPPAPAPPAPGSPPRPGTGSIGRPRCVYCPSPPYSRQARANGVEGVVVLDVVIQTDGHPGDIKLVKGVGSGLDEAAIATVRTWRFTPAIDSSTGAPVATLAPIEISFSLLNK